MPPKPKLHKNSGKSVINTDPGPSNVLSPELAQQFELELCWCIQQLQNSLKSGKLDQKQTQTATKALNSLMSNASPIIKKRQVMRLTFGDYRAKMAVEEQKSSKNVNMKVTTASPSKKSVFVKKSTGGAPFKFEFPQPKNDDSSLSENLSNVKLEGESTTIDKFVASDNAFRFNFNENDLKI